MEFNCIILAGGKSSRLRTDKALIHFGGLTLLEKLVTEVEKLASEVIIVSNNPAHHNLDTVEVCEQNAQGPLVGILKGLQQSNKEWNLVLSVDMPFLNLDKLILLLKPSFAKNTLAVIPEHNDRPQFLSGFYQKAAIPVIKNVIAEEKYSMKAFFESTPYFNAVFDNFNNYSNLNSMEDVQKQKMILVKIIAFGQVHEALGLNNLSMLTKVNTIKELKQELLKLYPKLSPLSFRIAVNQNFEKDNYLINTEDEIALLPPFAGG